MAYKLLVKVGMKWQEIGLQHTTFEDARNEARTEWRGYRYLVLPA